MRILIHHTNRMALRGVSDSVIRILGEPPSEEHHNVLCASTSTDINDFLRDKPADLVITNISPFAESLKVRNINFKKIKLIAGKEEIDAAVKEFMASRL